MENKPASDLLIRIFANNLTFDAIHWERSPSVFLRFDLLGYEKNLEAHPEEGLEFYASFWDINKLDE